MFREGQLLRMSQQIKGLRGRFLKVLVVKHQSFAKCLMSTTEIESIPAWFARVYGSVVEVFYLVPPKSLGCLLSEFFSSYWSFPSI